MSQVSQSVSARCTNIQQLINSAETEESNKERVNNLNTRRLQLEPLRGQLMLRVERALFFAEQGLLKKKPKLDKLQRTQELLQKLLEVLGQDPDQLTRGRNYNLMIRYVEAMVDKLGTEISTAWQKEVEDHTPVFAKQDIDLWKGVSGDPSKIDRIPLANEKLKAMANKVPATVAEIEAFRLQAARLQKMIDDLNPNLPPEVKKFLKQVYSYKGAPLASLTDPVRKWLESKRLLGYFRIKQ